MVPPYTFPAWRTVALDLETTGINRDRDRILQYGIWGVEAAGGPVYSVSALVDAETDVGRDPANIPGVSRDEVRTATPLRDGHLAKIREACDKAVVVMHNRHYDWTFIANEFKRNGKEPPQPRAVCCTLEIARKVGLHPPHTLGALCNRFRIPLELQHNALHDAKATFALFVLLANRHWNAWYAQVPRLRGCWRVHGPYWLPRDRRLRAIVRTATASGSRTPAASPRRCESTRGTEG